MFICPNCQSRLKRVPSGIGSFWYCPICDGRAVTLPVLHRIAPEKMVHTLWRDACSGTTRGEKECPFCERKMHVVPLSGAARPLDLDVCRTCRVIWFDPNEFEKVPEPDKGPPARKGPPPVSKTMAEAERKLLQEERKEAVLSRHSPDNWWEIIPAVFGLPVEYDYQGISGKPVITWGLSALMVLIYIAASPDLSSAVRNWGLVPAELYRHYGLTMVTSSLLHGGVFHLLSNLYFFLVFGDNVEDELGRGKYILLLAAATLLGDAFHVLVDPRAAVPLVGASGAISGIIAYYALRFPKTRVGMLIFVFWFRIPVGLLMVFWIAFQSLGVLNQVSGFGNVSALAHLGGAGVGFLFWLYFRSFTGSGMK